IMRTSKAFSTKNIIYMVPKFMIEHVKLTFIVVHVVFSVKALFVNINRLIKPLIVCPTFCGLKLEITACFLPNDLHLFWSFIERVVDFLDISTGISLTERFNEIIFQIAINVVKE